MKKVLMLCCALFALGLTQMFAQTTTTAATEQAETAATAAQISNDVEVTIADLPQPVQTALQGADYAGWEVAKSFVVQKDGATFYKLILKRGAEEQKVKLDAEGKPYKMQNEADKQE